MRYLSIDIETTGLNPETDQVLSVGLIIEDTEKKLPFREIPKLHLAILRDRISGSPYAINMNAKLINTINNYQCARTDEERLDITTISRMQFVKEEDVAEAIYQFLYINDFRNETSTNFIEQRVKLVNGVLVPVINMKTRPFTVTVAGKNFGTFDKPFLERLPNWNKLIRIPSRVIDPAVLFVDWANDKSLPNLSQCKVRAGLSETVTHNAVEDAWDVIELLRKHY